MTTERRYWPSEFIACIAMASLMTMGPNWAESWGEGDLESMNAAKMYDDAFTSDEGSQSFTYLVHHPTSR